MAPPKETSYPPNNTQLNPEQITDLILYGAYSRLWSRVYPSYEVNDPTIAACLSLQRGCVSNYGSLTKVYTHTPTQVALGIHPMLLQGVVRKRDLTYAYFSQGEDVSRGGLTQCHPKESLNDTDKTVHTLLVTNMALRKQIQDLSNKVVELEVKPDRRSELRQVTGHGCTSLSTSLLQETYDVLYTLRHETGHLDSTLAPLLSNAISSEEELIGQASELIQQKLDDPQTSSITRRTLLKLLIRLFGATKSLPSSFFLVGVEPRDQVHQDTGGGFADIFQGSYRGHKVALKRLRRFNSRLERPDTFQISFYREAVLWRHLDHPNILPFLGFDQQTFAPRLSMVTPWLDQGNVHDVMRVMEDQHIPIPLAPWLREITDGITYLHNQKVVHGDLRGANILIDDDQHIRLADFGLAMFANPSPSMQNGSHTPSTIRWMAPELIDGTLPRPNRMTDVYSFGCLCIELYTRHAPFSDIHRDAEIVSLVLQGERPLRPTPGDDPEHQMTDHLWDLLQYCWQDNPSNRPTMSDIYARLTSVDLRHV